MDKALVERVRSFNRTVTERVGALNDHFLGRDHSLGEARLLWEIGSAGAEVRELRSRLELDSAYVSRLLRSLERQGLVMVEASQDDRRVRRARLTTAGRAERAELDQRAAGFAQTLLEPLSESQQARLAAAMAEVEQLLLASTVRIAIADPDSADARWCLEQYVLELNERFDAGWDPARSISAQAHELVPPAGLFLVAYLRQQPVGCGALKFHADAPTELKRMWVSPQVRGLGVGRRLLQELERHAREAGVTVLHLETNRTLREAIALYRHSGYQEVEAFNDEPYAHHWFEKRL
ncbi:MAG TPA: bifunctional helix-turn-helix transcriptional regulator/GNAT family N-acetyltransferase [Ktedonobacterales bacterium]|jgi:DNA-binding MarR family transcriptional regulator/N-acetylglutamate synthase-like GNAT family acetyltransferase|nr:bifunctional helix-turn-helix transcriptional regulator/GNAT family N-acetyltransferase [Ktedonobacterales bacterium]